jgi:septum formation topological specificity factor MinE
MRRLSFHEWLKNRADEAPDAERLALLIAQSGAAGISPDYLRKFVRLRPETLDDLLKALVATGQLSVFEVNGELRYRATV